MTTICDFCSTPSPVWRYPCESFDRPVGGLRRRSVGDWLACDTCSTLIEANEPIELARRALGIFLAKYGRRLPPTVLRADIASVHGQFLAHRAGPRAAVEQ